MKALPILLFALSALAGAAHAGMTPAEAFNQGKTFGNTGKGGAGGTVSGASGAANVPKYNTSCPGVRLLQQRQGFAGHGRDQQADRTASPTSAANAYDQQECDAVNFLSKNPSVRPIVPLSKTDPIITGSDPVIKNPGTAPASGTGQVCRTVTQNNPGEYVTETCTTARKTDFSECDNTLDIQINWNYYCPAFTIEGPTIIPGTEKVPPQGKGIIPPTPRATSSSRSTYGPARRVPPARTRSASAAPRPRTRTA
jgi:hypothetical protein